MSYFIPFLIFVGVVIGCVVWDWANRRENERQDAEYMSKFPHVKNIRGKK